MTINVRLRILYFDDDRQYKGDHVTSALCASPDAALTALDDVYTDLQDQVNKQGGFVFVENSTGDMPPKLIMPSRKHRVLLAGEYK